MTKYQNGGLSHHEELRYFYLLRNLSYLSENEKREFAFLKSKMEAGRAYATPSATRPVRQPDPYLSPKNYYEEDSYATYLEEDPSLTPNGLPLYPKEEKKRSKRQARAAARKTLVPRSQFMDKPTKKTLLMVTTVMQKNTLWRNLFLKLKSDVAIKKVALSVSLNYSPSYCY